MFGDFPHLASICSNMLQIRSKASICPKASLPRHHEDGMSFMPHYDIIPTPGGLMWKSVMKPCPLQSPN